MNDRAFINFHKGKLGKLYGLSRHKDLQIRAFDTDASYLKKYTIVVTIHTALETRYCLFW